MARTKSQRGGTWIHRWRVARTPGFSQETDYLRCVQPPSSLVCADGSYVPGWFQAGPESVNVEDSRAGRRRYQRWFHIQFDAGRYFVVANLVHLTLGSNTAVMVLDKESGHFTDASHTDMWPRAKVEVFGVRDFRDPGRNSYIRQRSDNDPVEFSLEVDGVRLCGVADLGSDRPFIQCTGYHGANGSMQWWGNLSLRQATLTVNGQSLELPAGSQGTYDLTWGHRRPVQNWNWLSATGNARCRKTGACVPLSILSATDQPGALPVIDAAKNNVWLADVHYKLGELCFDYEILDAERRDTGPWRIHYLDDSQRMELNFAPGHRRRETRSIPLVYDVDFHQYYGDLTGEICLGGLVYDLEEVFALCEDSWMVM